MYSCRLLNRAGASNSQSAKEPGEVGPGELPLERLGEDLVVILEARIRAASSSSDLASAG